MGTFKVYTVSQIATVKDCENKEEAKSKVLNNFKIKESDILKTEEVL